MLCGVRRGHMSAELLVEEGDLAITQPQAGRRKVFSEVGASARSRNQQYIRREDHQPREGDLSSARIVGSGNAGDDGVGEDRLALRPRKTQGTERHERDLPCTAFVQEWRAVTSREIEEVLHADDFGYVDT